MKKPHEIINDPVKATLFGKFYEKIIRGWLKEVRGFKVFDGKPRIYWKDVRFAGEGSDKASKINAILKKYKNEKQFCTPDGFLQKDGKFYIWEAKNWPLWTEGKKPLEQLRDLLLFMPFILATKAVYKKQEYYIHGILFFWWSKPEGVESLVTEINNLIAPNNFEIFYTNEILEDCIKNKYPWYLDIMKKEKYKVDELWKDLLEDA